MCLYNYNNKFQTSKTLNNEEYELLNQIYQSIASNDNVKVKELTEQLISLQNSEENIKTLQDGINSLQ
ncbi:MAG: hypothetical protein ACRC92_00305 [Peptostreptococcaceae bacterium]